MSQVQLYVYDLSGGLAKALSLQVCSMDFAGHSADFFDVDDRQTDRWDLHGQPLQMIDFGETAIDEETFNEYLSEIREHYTADKVSPSESLDPEPQLSVIQILTAIRSPTIIYLRGSEVGTLPPESNYNSRSLPDLPADFLSTPFGASLRPTIDNMFRRPTPGTTPAAHTPTQAAPPADISGLLTSVVNQSTGSANPPLSGLPAAETVAAPVHMSTNSASFNSLLNTHKTAIVFFTSANCGPCRMVEPAFEDHASDKGGPDIAFVKVSLDGMGGQGVAAQYGIRATPTFLFFLNGEKTDELKGPDKHELKTKIDLLLYQAFPPHPHMTLAVPSLKQLSTQPIIYEQVPDLSKLLAKLQATTQSIDQLGSDTSLAAIADLIRTQGKQPITDKDFEGFKKASDIILAAAPPQELFPLLDLWRLALLVGGFTTKCTVDTSGLANVLRTVAAHLEKLGSSAPKALALTGLRLQSNVSANYALLRRLVQNNRSDFTQILISGLLHGDAAVRTAASTLAFNLGTHLQRSRRRAPTRPDPVEDGEWEVEVLTAVLESLSTEPDPGVVHRLVSAFGFIVLLSPWFAEQTGPLLEVLEAQKTLNTVAASSEEAEFQKLATGEEWRWGRSRAQIRLKPNLSEALERGEWSFFPSLTYPDLTLAIPLCTAGADAIKQRTNLLNPTGDPVTGTPNIPLLDFVAAQLSPVASGRLYGPRGDPRQRVPRRGEKRGLCTVQPHAAAPSRVYQCGVLWSDKIHDLVARKGASQIIASWHDWSGSMKWNGPVVEEKYAIVERGEAL
ncbi:hypothetical protein FRC10_007763 [Ceratobasidium sp. 414]|nr:hypothetical protein FRC10_007763 [Ceratobasidium sp. 414]